IGGGPAVTTDVANLGDLLYSTRSASAWNFSDEVSALLGFSALFGPNSTGDGARTFLYGADFTLKWRPVDNFRGWPLLPWQSEVMKRDYTADPFQGAIPPDDDDGHGHAHTSDLASVRHDGGDDESGHDEDDGGELVLNVPGALLRDW